MPVKAPSIASKAVRLIIVAAPATGRSQTGSFRTAGRAHGASRRGELRVYGDGCDFIMASFACVVGSVEAQIAVIIASSTAPETF